MTPDTARAWLDSIAGRGWKLELDRIHDALRRLGDPQRHWRAVHVAGTNGKGSTCAFVEGVLRAAGTRCGRFTSPHVVSLEERVRVDGSDCSPEALAAWLTTVRAACEEGALGLTYFEAMTAAAFLAFAEADVEVAAVEVGLGGRLDATRACDPAVTVITAIGLDHTRLLGSTVEAIAGEKAGILRPGVPLVTAATGPALAVIEDRARRVGAGPVSVLGRDFAPATLPPGGRLLGPHQAVNAACAVEACRIVAPTLNAAAVAHGLARAHIPGRLERVPLEGAPAELWVDCAHNQDGAEALATAIAAQRPGSAVHLVYGCLQDKPAEAVLARLPADRLTVVTVEAGPRTREAAELLALARARTSHASACANPIHAVEAALRRTKEGDIVLVAGSVYLAGAVLDGARRGEIWPRHGPDAKVG